MNARHSAYRVLSRVEREGAYSNLALMAELAKARTQQPRKTEKSANSTPTFEADRRLTTELVYGVLRNYRYLDAWLAYASGRPIAKIDPAVKRVLQLALYQLLHLDRIPAHAVLAEAGKLTGQVGRKHAVGFVNAVLHRVLRERQANHQPPEPTDPVDRLALRYSIPDWLMARWYDTIKKETADPGRQLEKLTELAEQTNQSAPLVLCPNRQRVTAQALIERLKNSGMEASIGKWIPDAVVVERGGFHAIEPLLEEGLCHVMDEAAQLVTALLDPQPGERILDCCAAPGGKTLDIASRVGPTGQVLAVDVAPKRLGLLEQQAKRHGFEWVDTLNGDAGRPLKGLAPNSFDRVLVDAPCSALGTIRRHPEMRWRRKPEEIPDLAKQARTIVENALQYVKPNGVLVFSVCTTTSEEGIEQLRHVIDKTAWTCELVPTIPQALYKENGTLRWFDTQGHAPLDGFFAFRLRSL